MEILTINLGATETKSFRKAGSYFEILESVGAIGVRFYTTLGGQNNSIDGGVSGLYLNADFGAFDIANQLGLAQSIKVLVCDAGELGGSRRQPGVVSVIDSARQLAAQNLKFANTASIAAPGAGNYAQLQLWNGSAKYGLAVRGVWIFSSDIAGSVGLQGNAVSLPAGTTQTLTSKKVMSSAQALPDAAMQTVRASSATGGTPGVPSLVGLAFANINISAGAQQTRMPLDDGPIVIGPGAGLVLAHNVANSGLVAYFEGEAFTWAG